MTEVNKVMHIVENVGKERFFSPLGDHPLKLNMRRIQHQYKDFFI